MKKMIAFCGLVCSDCSTLKATQSGDTNAMNAEIAKWQVLADKAGMDVGIDADYLSCDGCLEMNARLCGLCLDCAVRACGIERKVDNCGQCDDYPCDKVEKTFSDFEALFNIEDFFGYHYNPRDVLDEIALKK